MAQVKKSLRDLACAYVQAGFCVIPITSGDKKPPLVKWQGFTKPEHRPSLEQVREWWRTWPTANIGIVTGQVSGVNVLDLDYRNGADRAIDFATFRVDTPSGGRHYYFLADTSVGSPAGVQQGVDIRGDGGYILAPGSVRSDGKTWQSLGSTQLAHCNRQSLKRWSDVEKDFSPQSKPIPLPAESRAGWAARALHVRPEAGTRNDTLARLAGYFVSKNLSRDMAEAILFPWAARCGLEREETTLTIRSIYRNKNKMLQPSALSFLNMEAFCTKYQGAKTAWLVEDWLPMDVLSFLVGPPGVGKSWLTLDLALSVALGQPFMGIYPVHRSGPVLLLNLEDSPSLLAERLGIVSVQKVLPEGFVMPALPPEGEEADEGFWINLTTDAPVHILEDKQFSLDSKDSMHALERAINKIRPVLVVIDPLYVASTGSENFFASATAPLNRLKELRTMYRTGFCIVHHTRKLGDKDNGREQTWGSQLLNASCEASIQLRPATPKGMDDASFTFVATRSFKTAAAPRQRAMYAVSINENSIEQGYLVREVTELEAEGEESIDGLTLTQQSIVDVLQGSDGRTQSWLATQLNVNKSNVCRNLEYLCHKGVVISSGPGVKGRPTTYRLSGIEL